MMGWEKLIPLVTNKRVKSAHIEKCYIDIKKNLFQ